ncbi:MAG: acetyl-CoA carboxylase biotin carboxyl carrier protein subunit [Bdellovibrionales bacterium]|nr:acetyl-CoA carboxylase biotin carboxyl carrier protein subunit [Bdellovibrionales bacterium]
MKLWPVEILNQKKWVFAERRENSLWFHWKGCTYVLPLEEPRNRNRKGQQNPASGRILAPMPGRVTKISAREGDSVTAGTTLVIMEAMKMEYTLAAETSGSIEKVSCQVGDQVSLGQELVRMQPLSQPLSHSDSNN